MAISLCGAGRRYRSREGKMKYPFGVMRLNITGRCNFNCRFCAILPGGKNLNYEEAVPEKWIDAVARQQGEYAIIISGGEPSLYGGENGLARVVDSFSDIPTKIYTNGSNPGPIVAIKNRKNLGLYVSYQYKKISVDRFKKNVLKLRDAGFAMSNIHCPSIRVDPDRKQIEADLISIREAGLSVALDHPYLGWVDGKTTGRLNDESTGEMFYYDDRDHERSFADRKFRKTVRCSINMEKAGNACMYFSVGPDGSVWFCYRGFVLKDATKLLGNFFDEKFQFDQDASVLCDDFGFCNVCDGFGRRRVLV